MSVARLADAAETAATRILPLEPAEALAERVTPLEPCEAKAASAEGAPPLVKFKAECVIEGLALDEAGSAVDAPAFLLLSALPPLLLPLPPPLLPLLLAETKTLLTPLPSANISGAM